MELRPGDAYCLKGDEHAGKTEFRWEALGGDGRVAAPPVLDLRTCPDAVHSPAWRTKPRPALLSRLCLQPCVHPHRRPEPRPGGPHAHPVYHPIRVQQLCRQGQAVCITAWLQLRAMRTPTRVTLHHNAFVWHL